MPNAEEIEPDLQAKLTSSLINLVRVFLKKHDGWHLRNKLHGSSCMHVDICTYIFKYKFIIDVYIIDQ